MGYCQCCDVDFTYKQDDTKWYEFAGYSAKTVICPYCKRTIVVKYLEDISLDVNNDPRYYSYKRRK